MSNHAAGDRQCLFEFHVTYFDSPHFSGLPYFLLMRTEPTRYLSIEAPKLYFSPHTHTLSLFQNKAAMT